MIIYEKMERRRWDGRYGRYGRAPEDVLALALGWIIYPVREMFHLSSFSLLPMRNTSYFEINYNCYPVSQLPGNEREALERGGKIILPPSALETLTRLDAPYPMMFKLVNEAKGRSTHAGVLEFVADEEKVYLPEWMMNFLEMSDGESLHIESITLPVAEYSKFQPLSEDFLDITDPKAVLENSLRDFACLTTGDIIAIMYNRRVYRLKVLETRPEPAVNIIQCDMFVEFDAPEGYTQPQPEPEQKPASAVVIDDDNPFQGSGVRLDGKTKKKDNSESSSPSPSSGRRYSAVRGIPDYEYTANSISFNRTTTPISDRDRAASANENNHVENNSENGEFQGQGYSIGPIENKNEEQNEN